MLFNNQKFLFTRFLLILSLTVSLLGVQIIPTAAAPGDTTLVSLGSIPSSLGANGSSYRPSISADGRYITFYSSATNLVSNDTNGKTDIFVFDRQTGLTERVSVDSNGVQANGDSSFPSLSVDGRYVVFRSYASNLVNGDTNSGNDVFLHDRQTGLTERIAATASQSGSDSAATPPTISSDGRYVAFASESNSLVNDDTNDSDDIFVFDRQAQVTERVSVSSSGEQADFGSFVGAISANGQFVVFESFATNLVDGDTNGVGDIFVYDRQTGMTEQVSVDSNGAEGDSSSDWPSISEDGHFIAFSSYATNLVNGDTNGETDVFVHDRQAGITERVSVSSGGVEGNYNSYAPSISSDGRYVSFASYAGNLVSGDTNNAWDVFVHNRQTGTTERVSVASDGTEGDSHSDSPSISGDGHYIVFDSDAGNLTNSDLNSASDIFVHDRQTDDTEQVSVGPVGMGANQNSYNPSISADGRYVSFVSIASNFVIDDTNRRSDVFVYDRQLGIMERVSVDSGGAQANDHSYGPVTSTDGRYIAFASLATNLVNDDTNHAHDIFVHDRQTGVTERVSVNSSGVQANNAAQNPSISGDGRYVAFESYATNLVIGDTGVTDIFLRDRQTGVTERISTAPGGVLANGGSYTADISADGRYVTFQSNASNLVASDTNGKYDIFVYDHQLGVMERVSVDSAGLQANNASYSPSISGDGRYVAFRSSATNLVPDDTNDVDDIFIYDRQTHVLKRVSVNSSGASANASSDSPSISADGHYVAFTSNASNLVDNDTNNLPDIFIYDRQNGTTKRVAVDSSGLQANGSSGSPSITANGQFVAFMSGASNLVNGDNNYSYDIFVHENDISPRVLSVVCADSDPTNAASIDFTVTFSEPVTGVDTTAPFNDFALVTTGVTGASITGVDGADATYTVTVNTGSGNGTIRLDVHDDDSITDAFNNPLGGEGNGNGDFTSGEEYSIVKSAPIPGVPVLVFPASGTLVYSLKPVLDWKDSSPAAHHYQIQIATNNAFTAVVMEDGNVATSTFTPSSDLLPGKLYYWRVKAFNIIGAASGWSTACNFKTPLTQPVLDSPSNGEILLTDRPTFDWNDVPGASQYNIQVSALNNFSTLLLNATVNGSQYAMSKDLPQNKTLYWRVRAKTSVVKSLWSAKWSFKTGNPPSVPMLVSPANGALIKDYTPLFNWNNSTIPAGTAFKRYELQADEDSDFSSPTLNIITTLNDVNDSDFTPDSDLASNTKYYWRVRAVNASDHVSGWSKVWSFRTVILAPQSLTIIPTDYLLRPSFDWEDATGPETISGYTIQISTGASFNTFLINSTTPVSNYTLFKDLPAGKTIYWRVRVNGANGPSAWSTAQFIIP